MKISIDGSALTSPMFLIPGKTDWLRGNDIPEVDLEPGTYNFQVASGYYCDFQIRVTEAGKVDYDHAHDGFLDGRGTSTLIVRGHTIEIDMTRLSHQLLPMWVGNDWLAAGQVHSVTLVPASCYGFHPGSGLVCDFQFKLGVDGKVDYAADHGDYVDGRGTTKLILAGCKIAIDPSLLTHGVYVHLATPANEFFHTRKEYYVLPVDGIVMQPASGMLADLAFGVDRSGHIQYDGSCDGFLSGRGTDALVLCGYTIHLDGRHLSHDIYLLATAQLGFLSHESIHTVTLLPTQHGYSLQPCSGVLADMVFRLTRAGAVDYDGDCDGFLSGRGTDTLVLRGYTIHLDGRRLSHGIYLLATAQLGFLSHESIHTVTLLPTQYGYSLQPGSGVLADMVFRVKRTGAVDYDGDCDGFVSGRGTDTIVLRGYPVLLNASDTSTGFIGLPNAATEYQHGPPPYQLVVLLPAQWYEIHLSLGWDKGWPGSFQLHRDGSLSVRAKVPESLVVSTLPCIEVHGSI
jgi:hypothetical protein